MQIHHTRRITAVLITIAFGHWPVVAQQSVLPRQANQARTVDAPLALEGYCSVCLMRGQRWVKGTSEHSVVFDGRQYLFPSENEKSAFLSAPSQYTPVLNGDSIVAYADSGKRVPGSIRQGMLHDGRLYLFQSEAEKQRFTRNPNQYARADLAYRGQCAVCRSNGGNVAGKPEFTARYQGIRYWFPTDGQREQFLTQPANYAVETTVATMVARSGESCPCGSKNCKACQGKAAAPAGGVPVKG